MYIYIEYKYICVLVMLTSNLYTYFFVEMLKKKQISIKHLLMLLILGVLRVNCQRKVNNSQFTIFYFIFIRYN